MNNSKPRDQRVYDLINFKLPHQDGRAWPEKGFWGAPNSDLSKGNLPLYLGSDPIDGTRGPVGSITGLHLDYDARVLTGIVEVLDERLLPLLDVPVPTFGIVGAVAQGPVPRLLALAGFTAVTPQEQLGRELTIAERFVLHTEEQREQLINRTTEVALQALALLMSGAGSAEDPNLNLAITSMEVMDELGVARFSGQAPKRAIRRDLQVPADPNVLVVSSMAIMTTVGVIGESIRSGLLDDLLSKGDEGRYREHFDALARYTYKSLRGPCPGNTHAWLESQLNTLGVPVKLVGDELRYVSTSGHSLTIRYVQV